MAEENH